MITDYEEQAKYEVEGEEPFWMPAYALAES